MEAGSSISCAALPEFRATSASVSRLIDVSLRAGTDIENERPAGILDVASGITAEAGTDLGIAVPVSGIEAATGNDATGENVARGGYPKSMAREREVVLAERELCSMGLEGVGEELRDEFRGNVVVKTALGAAAGAMASDCSVVMRPGSIDDIAAFVGGGASCDGNSVDCGVSVFAEAGSGWSANSGGANFCVEFVSRRYCVVSGREAGPLDASRGCVSASERSVTTDVGPLARGWGEMVASGALLRPSTIATGGHSEMSSIRWVRPGGVPDAAADDGSPGAADFGEEMVASGGLPNSRLGLTSSR